MARVRILLIPEHRNSLLASLPAGSNPWRLLDGAIEARFSSALFDDNYEIVCDERDACVLLHTAQENCPSAVETIEAAISQSQQKNA
jgi:hypothetical protein